MRPVVLESSLRAAGGNRRYWTANLCMRSKKKDGSFSTGSMGHDSTGCSCESSLQSITTLCSGCQPSFEKCQPPFAWRWSCALAAGCPCARCHAHARKGRPVPSACLAPRACSRRGPGTCTAPSRRRSSRWGRRAAIGKPRKRVLRGGEAAARCRAITPFCKTARFLSSQT